MGINIIDSKSVSPNEDLVLLEKGKKRTLVLSSKRSMEITTAMPADKKASSTWSGGRIESECSFGGVDEIAGWHSKSVVGKIWKNWKIK
tara:strand:- start:127 stop:393 length:267 start_codon:yes stop_codon:yes gene_type:complete